MVRGLEQDTAQRIYSSKDLQLKGFYSSKGFTAHINLQLTRVRSSHRHVSVTTLLLYHFTTVKH
jgi:hypothetical protein